MSRVPTRPPAVTSLLAATAMGVYLLVVGGATAAIADAARACSGWPVCRVPTGLGETALLIAWGHRLVALAVGVLALATAAAALLSRDALDGRVLAALGVALVLFPVQIGIGAVVVTAGPTAALTGAHLLVGMVIFTALVLALAWHLEPVGGSDTVGVAGVTNPSHAAGLDTGIDPRPELSEPDFATAGGDARDSAGTESTNDSHGGRVQVREHGLLSRARSRAVAYARLTKPRLMWLLCLVAAAGMALAAGPALSARTVVLTLGGGVLAIGASGTFNHVFERDRDRRMSRTADRPVATHQVPIRNAIAFGVALTAAALAVFWQLTPLAAALGLAAVLFYSVIYTLVLKPNTVQNTVIGGFAGALPALIGWAAVTGSVGLPGLVLAGVIFLWTPAHFYNLALAYKEDYARGGFPMMPVVRGDATTRKHILWYLGATLLAAVGLTAVSPLGWIYAGTTSAFGAVFLWTVVRLHRERDEAAAFRAFHASNAYLGALLLAVVVDALAV